MAPWRIRDHATFESLSRSRWRARRGPIGVSYVPATAPAPARVAYAVGRGAGSSVARNRIRRRLRPIMAELALEPGSYLIAAGPEALDADAGALRRDVVAAVDAAVRAAADR